MKFKTKFTRDYYDNLYGEEQIENCLLDRIVMLSWSLNGVEYNFLWEDDDRPEDVYLLDNHILTLYYKDHNNHTHPNNLVLYNLKKDVVKVIENPMLKKAAAQKAIEKANEKPLTFWQKLFGEKPKEKKYPVYPFSTLKKIIELDGRKYIPVGLYISGGYGDEQFIYFLDAETFEFHPKYYDYWYDPDRELTEHIKYGREE